MNDPATAPTDKGIVQHNDLTIVAGYQEVLRANHLDSLEALLTLTDAESLSKPGLSPWRERLRLSLIVGGKKRTFYLKRFSNPPHQARRQVKKSGSGAASVAGVEWAWMRRLADDGIPCVSPVAFGEQFRGSRELRSAILTAAVPGASLEYWVGQWTDADRSTIRGLVVPLATLVARLHERGYIHRDLYLSHVFYDPASPPAQSLRLIDLQRMFRAGSRRRRWIIKDLTALNFSVPSHVMSNTERLRWLTRYLSTDKLDASARRLVYRVVGKTRCIARHERHRAARRQMGGEGR